MSLVYCPGVFDLFHVGHLRFLEQAAALGSTLVVGVASDDCVLEDKGRPPIIPYQDRVVIVRSLKCVDIAEVYYRLEFLTHLRLYGPDIVAVGATWGSDRRHIETLEWCALNDRRLVMLPYYPHESTTNIKERVKNEA